MVTDATGTLKGKFTYSSVSLNLSTGVKTFRLTNSRNNNKQTEGSFAEAVFFSDGLQREIADEILRPPPPPPPPPSPPPPAFDDFYYDPPPTKTRLQEIYEVMRGGPPDAGGYKYWVDEFGTDNPTNDQIVNGLGPAMVAQFMLDSPMGQLVGPVNAEQATVRYSEGVTVPAGKTAANSVTEAYRAGVVKTPEEANQILINTILANTTTYL